MAATLQLFHIEEKYRVFDKFAIDQEQHTTMPCEF